MKTKDIVKGGKYTARVSGKMVTVEVLRIFTRIVGNREQPRFECRNLLTKRVIEIRSAQRFRASVGDVPRETMPRVYIVLALSQDVFSWGVHPTATSAERAFKALQHSTQRRGLFRFSQRSDPPAAIQQVLESYGATPEQFTALLNDARTALKRSQPDA